MTDQQFHFDKTVFFNSLDYARINGFSVRCEEPVMYFGQLPAAALTAIDEYCLRRQSFKHLPLNINPLKVKSERYYDEQRRRWESGIKAETLFLTGFEELASPRARKTHQLFFKGILCFFKEKMFPHQTVFYFGTDDTLDKLVTVDAWTAGRFARFRNNKFEPIKDLEKEEKRKVVEDADYARREGFQYP